uniref:Uncharacterized protein n=1 Tax=Plectus sambesii TaxID=2011161 RepID=A0A914UZZ1_9BILA
MPNRAPPYEEHSSNQILGEPPPPYEEHSSNLPQQPDQLDATLPPYSMLVHQDLPLSVVARNSSTLCGERQAVATASADQREQREGVSDCHVEGSTLTNLDSSRCCRTFYLAICCHCSCKPILEMFVIIFRKLI